MNKKKKKRSEIVSKNMQIRRFKTLYNKSILHLNTFFILIIILISIIFLNTKPVRFNIQKASFIITDFISSNFVNLELYIKNYYDEYIDFIILKYRDRAIYLNDHYNKTQEYIKLEAKIIQLTEENEALKREINYQQNVNINDNFDYFTTKVTYTSANEYGISFIIPLEEKRNIQIGNAVVAENNFIGKISEIYKKRAKVLLLTSPNIKIVGRIPSINADCIVHGLGNNSLIMKNSLAIQYLGEDNIQKLTIGDEVITAGEIDDVPHGLIIGHITKIEGGNAYLTPSANISNISLVKVIYKKP